MGRRASCLSAQAPAVRSVRVARPARHGGSPRVRVKGRCRVVRGIGRGGLAEAGLGNIAAALDALCAAEAEMVRQPVHLDWYWRLALEWGMVGALIANGDHAAAHACAKRLCGLAAETDEQSWQALAWEARAQAALACGETLEAVADIAEALARREGVTVPLAEWRVHATGALVFEAIGDVRQSGKHSRLGAAIRERLAGTLPEGDPLRSTFERRSEALAAI